MNKHKMWIKNGVRPWPGRVGGKSIVPMSQGFGFPGQAARKSEPTHVSIGEQSRPPSPFPSLSLSQINQQNKIG